MLSDHTRTYLLSFLSSSLEAVKYQLNIATPFKIELINDNMMEQTTFDLHI